MNSSSQMRQRKGQHAPSSQQASLTRIQDTNWLREYVDVFDRQCIMWAFVKIGGDWDSIRLASEKCRNVCVRCHTAGCNIYQHSQTVHCHTQAKDTASTCVYCRCTAADRKGRGLSK